MKGKRLSQGSKTLAIGIAVVGLCIKVALKVRCNTDISINDVLKVSAFIAVVSAPIDVSIWLEHVAGILPGRKGSESGD